jgi:hypothetical protein
VNVDAVGYEHLFENGLAIALAAGFFLGLGGGRWCPLTFDGDQRCDRPGDHHDVRGVWGPQSRFQLAYWF